MEGEKGVECGSGGWFRGAVRRIGFEGVWCGRCEEISRSGFGEGISTRSSPIRRRGYYRMKDLKVLSALEATMVVPSGDLWKD